MALLASIQVGSFIKTTLGAALVGAGLSVSGQVADDYALRERAYALAGNGQCQAAISAFVELARNGGTARDWLAAATCAIETGDHDRAVTALQAVLAERHTLTIDEQLFALRSYAYRAEAAGDWTGTREAWRDAAALSGASQDQLMAARGARLAGNNHVAQSELAALHPGALTPQFAAIWHDEQAGHARRAGRNREALAHIDQAIAAEDTPWRRYDQGVVMAALGMHRSAGHALERAHEGAPDNADILVSLAYARRASGEPAAARAHYQRAVSLDPALSRLSADF
jgi:tetratricopeptide (TPR) repeat protein